MKAITICQPYAHLIVTPQDNLPCGVIQKRVENRKWRTSYRGPLAIHAGKSMVYMREEDHKMFPKIPFGAIVGVAELVDCVDVIPNQLGPGILGPKWVIERYPWIKSHVHAEGKVCWILNNVRRLRKPVACRGACSVWDVPPDVLRSVEKMLD